MKKPAILKNWKKIRLDGKKVFLRPIRKTDAQRIFELINDRNVTRFLSSVEAPVTMQQEKEFVSRCEKKWKKGKAFNFAICEKRSGLLVGGCGLNSFRKYDRRAWVGVWLGKKFWGKGMGFESVFLLFQFGFEELNLNKIEYGYLTANAASKGVASKMRTKKEGIQRQHTFKRGRFFDHAITSLLASEWKKKWGKQ
jgi:ribosomal-protein-alanine N-acetyltransferase